VTETQNLVSRNRDFSSGGRSFFIQAGRDEVISLASRVSLVITEMTSSRNHLDCRQRNWTSPEIDHAERKLDTLDQLLNDDDIAVDVSVNHCSVQVFNFGDDRNTLRRTATGRLDHYRQGN